MDDLGNWNPNPGGGGTDYHGISEITYDSSGAPEETWERSHLVDGRNQLAGVSQRRTGATGAPQVKPTIPYVYDAAGRMTYDGSFYYEYDFFGRLVQVRRFGFATFNPAVGTQPSTITDLARLGQLVVHYSYDGLGRLVRIQKPAGEDAQDTALSVTDQYFDGVRVVQEVGYREVPANLVTVNTGTGTVTHGLPLRAEQVQLPAPNPAAPTPSLVWSSRRVEREYVWAAEPGAYVDECVAQLAYTGAHAQSTGGAEVGDDQSPTFLYCLTDSNANVVGLTDEFGRLVAQYSYLPYGQVRVVDLFPDPEPADTGPSEGDGPGGGGAGSSSSLASSEALAATRGNHLGHQGLRFDRLDRPWRDPFEPGQVSDTALGAFAGVYHARNRVYQPTLGRFISDDPNGLGVPVLDDLAWGGCKITPIDVAPDLMGHFGDAMNAHTAYGCNPMVYGDPMGLATLSRSVTARITFSAVWAYLSSARRTSPSNTGNWASLLAGVGQAAGSIYAAWSFGDDLSLKNDKLWSLVGVDLFGGVTSAAGSYGVGWLGGRMNPLTAWAGNVGGAVAPGIGLGVLSGNSWSNVAGMALVTAAQGGLGFVQGAAGWAVGGLALAVGFYSGVIDYAAETSANWW